MGVSHMDQNPKSYISISCSCHGQLTSPLHQYKYRKIGLKLILISMIMNHYNQIDLVKLISGVVGLKRKN